MLRRLPLIYLGLLIDVLAFFYKPLFSEEFIFPWDFRYVQLPLISFLAEELHRGRMALWDPFTSCGDPIFANIQASFLHPLVFGAAWLSAHTSLDSLPLILEWVVVLQIWFAGIAAWHLFRAMGAGTAAAFAGAIVFETGGYFVSQTEHIGAVMAVAWLPLAWLSVVRLSRAATWGWLAVLSCSLGMAVLGGFPQATMAVFQGTALLAIVLVLLRLSSIRVLILTAGGCVLGIALASAQFLPTWQVTHYSVAKYRADWLGTGGGLYWQSFVSLVQPDRYHLFDLRQFKGPGDISFLYLYGSILGLCLVIFCLATSRYKEQQNRYTGVLAIMMFFGAFWMLGDKTPVWRAMYSLLPVSVRIGIHPEYTYCNFTLPFAGLAALGLDRLGARLSRYGNTRAAVIQWGAAVIIAADLFLVGSGRPMNCSSVLEEPGLSREAFDGSSELLDTVRNAVNRDVPPSRIDTMDASINWAECATLTRVPSANGSSPLGLENIIKLQMLALNHPGVRWGWYYQIENPDSPVLDILNIKYLIASPKAAETLRQRARYRFVASLPGNELFENLTVLPRYFLVSSVRQASDEDIEKLIRNGKVDLHGMALTEKPVSLAETSPSVREIGAAGAVRTLRYEPDSLELEVESPRPAFLVLSEADYPGWHAWMDGQPIEIYRTDLAFRGVSVASGKHHIRMNFHPGIRTVGGSISLASLGLVALMLSLRLRPIPGFERER